MPKAELHLHLEGAFRWQTLQTSLFRHYGLFVPALPDSHRADHRFGKFEDFLQLFRDYVDPWVSAPSGYEEILADVLEGLRLQTVRYAEIDISLALVERTGHRLEQIFDLLTQARQEAAWQGMEVRFFAGLNRHLGLEQALTWVKRIQDEPVITGIDLHGNETDWSARVFQPVFELARAHGKRIKVHAGEMVGPQSIWDAVNLGIDQIGHGTSAIQDLELVEVLRDRQILLELCPTSNERLGYIPSYQDHPIFELDRAGVPVTINSDDPAFFGTTLTEEMGRLMTERRASLADLKRWTGNALQKAVLSDDTRQQFIQELNAWNPSGRPCNRG